MLKMNKLNTGALLLPDMKIASRCRDYDVTFGCLSVPWVSENKNKLDVGDLMINARQNSQISKLSVVVGSDEMMYFSN